MNGASSPGTALTTMLKTVDHNCGEKPQIGKVFEFTGTSSIGVFFTVTDHPDGNLPLGGLVIAGTTAAKNVPAAMVYDVGSRFGQTVNPLLQQLFSAWNPNGAPTAGAGAVSNAAAAGGGAALPAMHPVSLADGTGALSLPAGWNLVPNQSAMAIASVAGPQGALLQLNVHFIAWDSSNPQIQSSLRRNIKFQHTLYYPSGADLTKSFADILQGLRAANGQGPAPLQLDSVAPAPGSKDCVVATGQINPDGSAMREMRFLMCRSTPNQAGEYFFILNKCMLPLGASDQLRATANAIMASYKPNMQRAQAIASAATAPMIAQMNQIYQAHTQALESFTQSQIANIHQIGANATAQYNANADAEARNDQGFSNYLLDQTVVQNNYTGAHATQWNSAADALVQANPNKYSYVSAPNYIPGTDY